MLRYCLALLLVPACSSDGGSPLPGDWLLFQPPVSYPAGGSTLVGLTATDLTGDGRLDLVTVARQEGEIEVLPGASSGTFGTAAPHVAGSDPRGVAAGDVDGNGILDLVVVGYFDNAVFVRLGAGGGAFAAPTAYALRNHGQQIAVGNLNGDAYDDVIAVHDGSGQPIYLNAFLGSATGTLEPVWELATDYVTSKGIALGDFDADGVRDLALATGDDRASVLVFRGEGTGAFAEPIALPPTTTSPGVPDGTEDVSVQDLNGDGRDDLVTAHWQPAGLFTVRLSSTGGFSDPMPMVVRPAVSVATGDVDGDGILDAVLAHVEDGLVSLLVGTGTGAFGSPQPLPVGPQPVAVALADFNDDGRLDLAVADVGDHRVRVLLNRGSP